MRTKIFFPIVAFAGLLLAQAPPRSRVLGVVASASGKGGVVKTDAGESVEYVLAPEAKIQKVAPGEKDLSKAQPIQAADIAPGDRVLVRGIAGEGGAGIIAQSVIVMSGGDIAQKQQKERLEWQRRGVGGLVVSADPKANEIKIKIPSMMGGEPALMTIAVADRTRIRRYAPDSVRFADAKPGTLDEIQPGDQLRALGDKNEAGTQFAAEEVVTGTFRVIAATITTVSAGANEIQVKELGTNKPLTVKVTADSNLRKMFSLGAGGPMAGGFNRPGGAGGAGGPAAPGATIARPAGAAESAAEGGPRPMGGGRRGDMSQLLDRLPKATLAELKPGETIIVASTKGASDDAVTAITLLANADAIVAMHQRRQQAGGNNQGGRQALGNWNMGDMPMISME